MSSTSPSLPTSSSAPFSLLSSDLDGDEEEGEVNIELLAPPRSSSQPRNTWKVATGGSLSDNVVYGGVAVIALIISFILLVIGQPLWVLYLLLQVALSATAPFSGDHAIKNWLSACFCVLVLSGLKTIILSGSSVPFPILSFIFATTALWDCSTASLFFTKVRMKLCCTTTRRCVIQSLVPSSVQFDKRKANLQVRGINIAVSGVSASCLFLLYSILNKSLNFPPLLETLFLLPILALTLPLLNAPSYESTLIFANLAGLDPDFALTIIQPYGVVMSARGPREFWARWSRPATLLIRHLFYHPFGGSAKPHVSVPALFLLNALCHFEVSKALVGERREMAWLTLFLTLGAPAFFEMRSQNKNFVKGAHAASLFIALHIALHWIL